MQDEEPSLRQLYPQLPEHELAEAEYNIQRYLGLVLRIYSRLEHDRAVFVEVRSLTSSRRSHKMPQRSDGEGALIKDLNP